MGTGEKFTGVLVKNLLPAGLQKVESTSKIVAVRVSPPAPYPDDVMMSSGLIITRRPPPATDQLVNEADNGRYIASGNKKKPLAEEFSINWDRSGAVTSSFDIVR